MRAPGNPHGPKGDESGPRKGKRVTPFKGTKIKRLKKEDNSNKNDRLRSPGATTRKSLPLGSESASQKEESPSSVPPGKAHSAGSPPMSKSSPKKRSASSGSSKAGTPKKEERGRPPKKSITKAVKPKKSPEKCPSVDVSPKVKKSPSRASCSPKRGRKPSVGGQKDNDGGDEKKRQRIATSIEAVIRRYCKDRDLSANDNVESRAKSPVKVKALKEEVKGEGGDSPVKRCRGRPKGSKNKVKKEGDKIIKEKIKLEKVKKKLGKKALEVKTDLDMDSTGSDLTKDLNDLKGKKKLPKGILIQKAEKKKHKLTKKVISSKVIKGKGLKSKVAKAHLSSQSKGTLKESESSESESECKKSAKTKPKSPKAKVKEEDSIAEVESKKTPKGKVVSYRSKGGKSVTFPAADKSFKKEMEIFSSDFSDQEEKMPIKPLKKALKEKWSRELKKSVKTEEGKKGKLALGRRREHPHVCYEEESDRDSEPEDLYPQKVKKEARSPGRKRKRKKSLKEHSDEDEKCTTLALTPVIPKRTARMASLNAIAMMACMNEDAKVPLPSFTQHSEPSMALVVRGESTIARRHSGDESEDSDDDSDRGYSPSRRPGKRKPAEDEAKDQKAKRRRRRRGELDVTMDMKDMVVTKRMASLNASAIMAASYSSESRSKRTHQGGASEVTKISFKATKKQNLKTRSVITVQETTKKVKKAQGEGSTEVEEHIIVKKKVKRQSGVRVEAPDTDREATDTDNEILPKSPDDSGVIMESTTITYVTTQTHSVPQTVTLSGVKEYSVSTSNGKTTTMMQQVQRKSVTTTCTTGPPTSTAAIPTALIPPTQHVQVAPPENRNQVSRAPPNYSPLGALEVMQPVMHHPPPPPPPQPPSTHFIPYPHPHHGPPIPHPHHLHHPPPPPPTMNSHHHHISHHPSSPYPPLSPHSPPYPPPSSSSSSSPACPSSTSPSTTPHPHPSPTSCHSSTSYRSPAPCSPGFPSPVSSPKQGPPPPGGAGFREDRPHPPPPMSSPNGLIERHHSAFSAPTPSTHSPSSGTGHGYQPVSGPIPTGGSPNAGSFKPPQGSPGGSSGPQPPPPPPPPPYSSPSRLTSPPPPPPPTNKPPHYSPNDHYPGSSHPYQSYPYQGASPYDKYYPRTPSYQLYQPPSYTGGQYPPPGEYGYQPPPSGTVHYSQESYTSYTLCVPAPPHGPPQSPASHSSSALALPPPPPTSNAPIHHHSSAPYTTYHCTEYTPVFPYPPPGPSPQNAVCCPAGGSKNVSSGPLTGSGKGPESSDCVSRKSLPGPSGPNACSNYQYYGGGPPPKNHQSPHMAPQSGQQHQLPPPPESFSQRQHHHQTPPHPHHHSYTSQQESMAKDLCHPHFNESSSSAGRGFSSAGGRSNVPKSPKDKRPSPPGGDGVPPPHKGAPIPVSYHKPSSGECKAAEGKPTSTTATSSATSLTASSVVTTAVTKTTSSLSTTFATRSTSCSSSAVTSSAVPTSPLLSRPLAVSTAAVSTCSTPSMNTPLLAIATPLTRPSDIGISIPKSIEEQSKPDAGSVSSAKPPPLSRAPRSDMSEEGAKNHSKSTADTTSSASSASGALTSIFPTNSAPLKTTTWVVQPSASSPPHQSPSGANPSRALHLSPTNTTISVSLSNTNSSTNSVMSTTAPIVASLENALVSKCGTTIVSDKPASFRQVSDKLKEKTVKDVGEKDTPPGGKSSPSSLSQRAGGRHHLLCQPLPLIHTKVTSVLAKVRPSNMLNMKPASEDGAKNHVSLGLKQGSNDTMGVPSLDDDAQEKLAKNDKCIALPRKRGRPPKSRIDIGLMDGTEGKPFCRAPGEVSAREDNVPIKRMSLLKSSGAKSTLALPPMTSQKKNKYPPFPISGFDFQAVKLPEDMKIDVKTETLGKIKAERVSPKQGGFKDPKLKPLNGDMDIFNSFPRSSYFQPPMVIGHPEHEESLKKKLKSENDCEDSKLEDRKTPKLGRPPKFLFSRLKGPRIKVGFKPKQRRKAASLLAYLKEKNNESDTSLGDVEAPLTPVLPAEEDLQDDPKKSPVRPATFPTYTALSIRGRRSSGAGKGKCLRKPKYYHGWSWDGEPQEGKVWLRNDEMLIIRKCYKAMKHKEGDTIRVRDCVLLRSGPRKTDLPFVAKVAALWEDPETCDMMMSILWYYRPEHTESGRREEDLADEIFASKHRDHLSVACIEDRCYVLTFNEYCRYRRLLRLFQEKVFPPNSPVPDSEEGYLRKGRQPPGCVVHDLLFFCRKVYDYRQKRILKNPC